MSKEQNFQERAQKTRRKQKLRPAAPKRRKSTSKQSEWYVNAKDQIAITSGASTGAALWASRSDNDHE